LAAGRQAEARAALRRAVRLPGPTGPAWIALVQFHLRLSQKQEAEEATDEARRAMTGAGASLTLAQCDEAVGRADRAEGEYRSALEAAPDDFLTVRLVAGFYERTGTPGKAVAP